MSDPEAWVTDLSPMSRAAHQLLTGDLDPGNVLRLLRRIPLISQRLPCAPRHSARHGAQHDVLARARGCGGHWRAGLDGARGVVLHAEGET
jgi:hypothetical protein